MSFLVTSFRIRKSHTKRMEASFLFTKIAGEYQGEDDGRIISLSNISWIYLSTSSFQAWGNSVQFSFKW